MKKIITKKFFKNIAIFVLVTISVLIMVPSKAMASRIDGIQNSAYTWNRQSKYDYKYTTGDLWWKKTYNCTVYKEARNWYMIFCSGANVSTGFEYKPNYKNEIVITQSRELTIGSQTVASMNGNVGIEEAGIKSGFGGSLTKTESMSWKVENSVKRTVDKTDPIGYYSYNVLINTNFWCVNGTAKGTILFHTPISQPYRAIVYSKTGNYSDATKYY